MPSFFDVRVRAWLASSIRSVRPRIGGRSARTALFAVAVLVSLPHALRSPAPHPGGGGLPAFTAAFIWMAYALAPWSALLPFAVLRSRPAVLAAAVSLLGGAIALRSAPLAAVGAAIPLGAFLAELDGAPSSTVLALGVAVLGLLIAHDLMPATKLLARATAAVAAATAILAIFEVRRRSEVLAALAIAAAIVVHARHG